MEITFQAPPLRPRLLDGVARSTPSTRSARRLDEDTKEVRAVSFNYARTERTFFDDELKGHFDRLEGMGPDKAEVSLVSKTRDEATWVVSFRRDDGPTEYSLYDTASHKLTPLFVSQPALSDYKFAHMEDVRIQARDGLAVVVRA